MSEKVIKLARIERVEKFTSWLRYKGTQGTKGIEGEHRVVMDIRVEMVINYKGNQEGEGSVGRKVSIGGGNEVLVVKAVKANKGRVKERNNKIAR